MKLHYYTIELITQLQNYKLQITQLQQNILRILVFFSKML